MRTAASWSLSTIAPAWSLATLAFVSGCSALPTATGQLRVTELGAEGGYPLLGVGEAEGCIVSVVGALPAELAVLYTGARCAVELGVEVEPDEESDDGGADDL